MDNENKEIELETQDTVQEEVPETDFDPTESEAFYSNLEAAISFGEEEVPVEEFDAVDTAALANLVTEVAEETETPGGATADEVLFAGVDAALAEQIEQEFGKDDSEISSAEEKQPNKVLAVWKGIPTWTKVLVSVILVILISVGLLFGTEGGRRIIYKTIVSILFDEIKVDPEETPTPIEEVISITPGLTITPTITQDPSADPNQNPDDTPVPTQDPALTPGPTAQPTPNIKLMDDPDIINVLLLGEENLYNSSRGRTDAIHLVSVNLNGGPLKIVSFQRDLFVAIPGHADDRLNSAYAYGGSKLIVETIENNFGVDIDAYAKVDFEGFEEIIDMLGGLKISLTVDESNYLNTTGYISNPSERNTVAGYQNMTGSQVLGYCRVRKVPTANGLTNNAGRNYRHRVVMQAVFDKYKEKGFIELASIMRQCLQYVTVSSNLEALAVDCLQAVLEKKMFEIETLTMPKGNRYRNELIRGMDVIVYDLENIDILQDFLYGE